MPGRRVTWTLATVVAVVACNGDDNSEPALTTLASTPTEPASTLADTTVATAPPAITPCSDVQTTGFLGDSGAEEDGSFRILATEGLVLGDGYVTSSAPLCDVPGEPPLGVDALIDGEWAELGVGPAPYELGPGGAVDLNSVVFPIWFDACDGEPVVTDTLRLRLADGVTIQIDNVTPAEQHVDLVVGCEGSFNAVRVARATTFRGYG